MTPVPLLPHTQLAGFAQACTPPPFSLPFGLLWWLAAAAAQPHTTK